MLDRLLFYVSGHGYGHATRAAAVIAELRREAPLLEVHVRSSAPQRLFPGAAYAAARLDDGMSQANALDVDLPATLAAHEKLGRDWDRAVAREAAAIRELAPALVVGDIPALCFAAAREAGVSSVAIGNFSWDWIFAEYARTDARFEPAARRYADAYASAEILLRLPMACPMPAFKRVEDLPLTVRVSALSRDEARLRLGVHQEKRPVVLVSFGGFSAGEIDAGGDDLSGFVFFGFTPKPRGLRGEWRELPRFLPMPHVDLVAACDAVVSKPGYGTISEAAAHGARLLYVPREDFPEIPALTDYISQKRLGAPLSRSDFFNARWRSPLEKLLQAPPPEVPRRDGARAAARRLLALAQVC